MIQNVAYPTNQEESLLPLEEPSARATATRFEVPRHSQSQYEVEDKVKKAEEQLLALQQKRERLEQQKQELEELSARQQRFSDGKAEVMSLLTEALPTLESEAEEAQRRAEFLSQMGDVFSQHLEVLNTMNPDDWDEKHLKVEVERGLSALKEAKDEIERFDQRLQSMGAENRLLGTSSPTTSDGDSEFSRWMKMGFAFALPIMIFTALTLLVTYIIVTQ